MEEVMDAAFRGQAARLNRDSHEREHARAADADAHITTEQPGLAAT